MKRNKSYKSTAIFEKLYAMYSGYCAYCGIEPATTIDHIIPVSYKENNAIENLVPCCVWCNLHAGDKMFDSLEDKRKFLLKARKDNKRSAQVICTSCCLPYQRPHMSSRLFECPECNNDGLSKSHLKEWRRFKLTMQGAGFILAHHDYIRNTTMELKARRMMLCSLYMDAILET
jgi:hypothetical protein